VEGSVLLAPQLPPGKVSPLAGVPLPTTTDPGGVFKRYTSQQDIITTYSLPFHAPDGQLYEIETGQSLAVSIAAMHSLNKLLLFATPLILFIGTLGGYLLMRKPLRPLLVLTEGAENIGRSQLGERLPVIPTADELERLTHSLNRMIGRMEEALSHNQRFSADASHELRTPLTIMRGEMEELLLLADMPPQAVDNLISTLDEVDRMSRIVSSLMTITRLDAGGELMAMEPVNLTALARSTCEQMRLMAVEKGFPLRFEAERDVWVSGDPMRLKQILVNLIDNAIKYTPQSNLFTLDQDDLDAANTLILPKGPHPVKSPVSEGVNLRIGIEGRRAVIEITDHGIGIAAESLPFIFDRFYRADYARNRIAGGVGLGLSIVKSIITAHEGTVSAVSEEGRSTTMRVELPLLSRNLIPTAEAVQAKAALEAIPPTRRPHLTEHNEAE
jgi:signal transduction histidine kinase